MERTMGATVGLLLLSAAVPPVPAADGETGPSPAELRSVAADGGRVVSSTADRPPAVEGRPAGGDAGVAAGPTEASRLLALPGVEGIGTEGIVVLAGLLGLSLVGAALLRRRTSGSTVDRTTSNRGRGPIDDRGDRSPGSSSTAGATTAAAGARTATERQPPTVRTDEESVLHLLIANNGRMRQARIVEETEWSKAKVSRVLSRMEEEGQVVRERDGREKVVQLADANSSVPL